MYAVPRGPGQHGPGRPHPRAAEAASTVGVPKAPEPQKSRDLHRLWAHMAGQATGSADEEDAGAAAVQAPTETTTTPAAAARQSLEYVVPSEPHTGE